MSRIHCSPAYGRDYESEEDVLRDWENGKDFKLEGLHSGHINKQDAENFGVPGGEINIRYNKKQEVTVVSGLKVNDN